MRAVVVVAPLQPLKALDPALPVRARGRTQPVMLRPPRHMAVKHQPQGLRVQDRGKRRQRPQGEAEEGDGEGGREGGREAGGGGGGGGEEGGRKGGGSVEEELAAVELGP